MNCNHCNHTWEPVIGSDFTHCPLCRRRVKEQPNQSHGLDEIIKAAEPRLLEELRKPMMLK